jgi:tyrosyl-DNA phosphodiesterase-1
LRLILRVPKYSKGAQRAEVFVLAIISLQQAVFSISKWDIAMLIHPRKIQTSAQAKQLQYLKPHLYHWAGDGHQHTPSPERREAGRRRAAPHIKTYIRFSNALKSKIDWALVTSANISKQAWGEARNSVGDVRISSYELGVLVTPEMYGEDAVMVPTFKTDVPGGIEKDDEKVKVCVLILICMVHARSR